MRRELYSRRGGRGYWNCCACMLKNEEKTVFLDLTWEILAFGRFLGEVESWKTSCTAQKKRGVRTLHLSNVRITSNGLLKILLALFECGTRSCCTMLRTFYGWDLTLWAEIFLQMQEWKLCLIATELLPLCLIIEMGKIRLCKADHNYSLPPPLLAGDSDKKSHTRSLEL